MKNVTEFLFTTALLINVVLFLPQVMRIMKEKSAKGISLLTFFGLLFVQLMIVLQGIIIQNYLLIIGCVVSMLMCGFVVIVVLIYRRKEADKYAWTEFDILNQLPCNIYWKDKDGIFLGCNDSNWQKFKCNSLSDLIGKTDYDILSKKEADHIRMVDARVVATGVPEIIEEVTSSCDKKTVYLSHKVPLKDKHNIIMGMLGVSFDVTNAKKAIEEKLNFLENVIAASLVMFIG